MVIKPYSHYISEIIKIITTSLSDIEKNPDGFRISGFFNSDPPSFFTVYGVGESKPILKEKISKLISDYLLLNEITDPLIISTRQNKSIEVCFLLSKTFDL